MSDSGCKEHLESLFEKYLNGDESAAKEFSTYVRLNADVPLHAQQLLAYKIQSPIDREAKAALKVLEVCVRNSGKLFHNEIGKYRFLNELIRVVSPKYLGPRSNPEVKRRIVEIMYSWTIGLKEQTKIMDAYSMLKKQKIVKEDPKFDERLMLPTPPPRERCSLIKDEAEEARLHKLITSSNPEDVALANEMIKTMYEKENTRIEKMGKKTMLIDETKEKIKLMDDIINTNDGSAKSTMGQIYHDLESIRPQLFRLTAETEDDNDELMLILRLTDEVTRIINTCKEKYPQVIASSSSSPLSEANDMLVGIQYEDNSQNRRLQELGCDLDLLGIDDPVPSNVTPNVNNLTSNKNAIDDLQQLNNVFMQNQFGYQPNPSTQNNGPPPTLVDLANGTNPMPSLAPPTQSELSAPSSVQSQNISPLTGIQFNVSDFKPSKTSRQLCEENGIRALLMRGENKIDSRPEVTVLLITIDSTCSKPIENLIFNAKVEKPYRIKCLQPSGNEFEAFNPVSSSSHRITQILLMGGRPKGLNWTLQFDLDDETLNKSGSIDF